MRGLTFGAARLAAALLAAALLVTVSGCGHHDTGTESKPIPLPADYVATLPSIDLTDAEGLAPKWNVTWLNGPHIRANFGGSTASGLKTDGSWNPARPVAPGHELLLIQGAITFDHAPAASIPTLSVLVDGREVGTKIDALHTDHADPRFAVSVPIGKPVALKLTDSGRTETLDLRTGKKTDAFPGYDPVVRLTTHDRDVLMNADCGPGDPGTGKPCTLSITMLADSFGARLTPWVPGWGWAPDRKLWAVFPGMKVTAEVQNRKDAQQPQSVERCVTLTTDGYTIKAHAVTENDPLFGNGPGLAFEVPTDFHGGDLVVRADAIAPLDTHGNVIPWPKAVPEQRMHIETSSGSGSLDPGAS